MTIVEHAEAFRLLIAESVTGLLDDEKVELYAAEPPSPVGGCDRIRVWVDSLTDGLAFDPDSCTIRTRLRLSYRIYVCYTEKAAEHSEAELLDQAQGLYDLMDAVWCGIVAAVDDGTFLELGSCADVTVEPMTTDRGGGETRAAGAVVIPYECAVTSS